MNWQAINPNYDDWEDESTYRQAIGLTAEYAALDIAERKFSDWDFPMEFEVWVRKNVREKWNKFEISVEIVPSFSAREIEERE